MKTPAACLGPAALQASLRALEGKHAGRLRVQVVGRSVEGRDIHLLTVGHGRRRILLWSQMHGDEPSATPALLDIADFLLSPSDADRTRIQEELTLLMVPMLNPDGAERYERRNAQAIDINRDALNLATPEGQLLKRLRDTYEPELGFNLHDQNRRTTVGATGKLATISLLAVAGDAAGTVTPGRRRAKRVASAIARFVEPFVPGGIARYDEDWNPRAFGDNLTAWGSPVVLIESGGLPPGRPLTDLTRLNFVALLSVLDGLARDDLATEPERRYESLPRNESGLWSDVIVRGGEMLQPGTSAPYRADLAFDVISSDRFVSECSRDEGLTSRITEVGDARLVSAGVTLDARARLVTPGFVASIEGLDARTWLNAAALEALGRLGVVELHWALADGDRIAAQALADALRGPGRPSVVLAASGEGPKTPLILTGPPGQPGSSRVTDVLLAVSPRTATVLQEDKPFVAILEWLVQGAEPRAATLKPGAPASFLLFRRNGEGPLQPDELMLEAVWINGVDIPIR